MHVCSPLILLSLCNMHSRGISQRVTRGGGSSTIKVSYGRSNFGSQTKQPLQPAVKRRRINKSDAELAQEQAGFRDQVAGTYPIIS